MSFNPFHAYSNYLNTCLTYLLQHMMLPTNVIVIVNNIPCTDSLLLASNDIYILLCNLTHHVSSPSTASLLLY